MKRLPFGLLMASLGCGSPSVSDDLLTHVSGYRDRVDSGRFGDDFNVFLTDAKLQAASARLRPLGAPAKIELETLQERGGMEQSTVRLSFGDGTKLEADMFRSVDGKVQQFLINKP